jgi:formiminoglutamase
MKNNKRYLASLASQFMSDENSQAKTIIFTCESDVGVIRNGGRNGARYAPEAIINSLKKLTNHLNSTIPLKIVSVSNQISELENFEKAQLEISNKISDHLKMNEGFNYIHLGGGHDHAYPLLMAINSQEKIKNILIINIDAHCDTRIDDFTHSGTPFRDFSKVNGKKTHLLQYGIHLYANSEETLSPLDNITEKHVYFHQLLTKTNNMTILDKDFLNDLPFELGDETVIFVSLDCDAIESSVMEGVSAVNHQGISPAYLQLMLDKIKQLAGPKIFGIYEYNPIYDNLSQKGARTISALIYQWLSR